MPIYYYLFLEAAFNTMKKDRQRNQVDKPVKTNCNNGIIKGKDIDCLFKNNNNEVKGQWIMTYFE